MTHPITTVGIITAAVLAVIALAVFAAGDSHLLVPSPESTAEGFVRQITTSRYRQTRQYIAPGARLQLAPTRLEAWGTALEARLGPVSQIDPAGAVIAGDRALATLDLHARRGEVQITVPLHREHGLWKVDGLPTAPEGFFR